MSIDSLYQEAVLLLANLIKTPSFSTEEDHTATHIAVHLQQYHIPFERIGNNIIAKNKHFSNKKKTILLNSHHDTVKIVDGWSHDPFGAVVVGDQLFGLGSNDAGASLVSLIACFVYYYNQSLDYNLVLVASAEEENFGPNGISSILSTFNFNIDLGIIGEPTEMHLAVAEKGLIVIDGYTAGVAGHAARDIGTNAIYLAIEDIAKIKQHKFEKISPVLGEVKTTITQIEAGYQHNVIPDKCHYVIDVRNTECYTNQAVLDKLQSFCHATLTPRSMKWQPSGIPLDHPIVKKGIAMGRNTFGSPTLSDQVHFTCPTLKLGPGVSERSHTPDEFITLSELKEGIEIYIRLLDGLSI